MSGDSQPKKMTWFIVLAVSILVLWRSSRYLLSIYFHLQEVGVEIAEAVSIILSFGPICSCLEVAHVILWLVENAAIASQGN